MGLLSGKASAARFMIGDRPGEIDFEARPFIAIAPGSEVRESIGFLPFEPGAEYEIPQGYAFRVRRDVLRPDPTLVKERLGQLLAAEMEQTGELFVASKTRRKLKQLADEELIVSASPRSSIVECAIQGETLWIGSASDSAVDRVVGLLRAVGVDAEPVMPEFDAQALTAKLLGDREITIEPVNGLVKLESADTKATLRGEVNSELVSLLDAGYSIRAARLISGDTSYTFDAVTYRVSSARIERSILPHWSERLDQRLAWLGDLFADLDEKFHSIGSKK